jgi:hypothetical protein
LFSYYPISVFFHPKFKIATPLSYIFQAAMGQCSSTLPVTQTNPVVETHNPHPNNTSTSSQHPHHAYDMRDREALIETHQQHPYSASSRKSQQKTMDFATMTTPNHEKSRKPKVIAATVTPNTTEPQSREPSSQNHHTVPMELEPRDPPLKAFSLPDHAVRTRCYKLNLDAADGLSSISSSKPIFLGPFSETLPTLTFSGDDDDDLVDLDDDDEDEDAHKDSHDLAVAIQTAQIFRGITVAPDGTILSQNARATRSNRSAGQKVKLSEKSRQAAKIDKANDLIEQDGSDNKLVSLVVIGEYDDMKYLVRDGSRKLREADGLPDEALLQVNRPRVSSRRPPPTPTATVVSSASSSRRRRSEATNATTSTKSPSSPQPLPKLKSNPRDTASQRRKESLSGLRAMRLDSCHDFMDTSSRGGPQPTNDDWTHAWNIWNCGAAPPPASPESRHEAPVYHNNFSSSRRVP